MRMKLPSLRKVFRAAAIFLFIFVLVLYIGLPALIGVLAVIPARAAVGPPPDSFVPVRLLTDDQVSLAGWYAAPANGAAILLLHGAGGSASHCDRMRRCCNGMAMACWRWTCAGTARAAGRPTGWAGRARRM